MVASNDKTIFVTGATGKQGGAVARHLLASGWQVRALSRQLDKPVVKELQRHGAEMVQGDLNDTGFLRQSLQGIYGVFSVQTFAEQGTAAEEQQGKNLADAAHAAGVAHFVYSSVGGAERDSGIPHFMSKWHVEQHLQALGVPRTILRPTFLMENFLTGMHPVMQADGTFVLAAGLKPETKVQMVAVEDLGAFATLAFNQPEAFLGKSLELAGDELTMPEVAHILESVLGSSGRFVEVAREQVRKASEETALMLRWFDDFGYQANIPALRSLYPPLTTFTAWARDKQASEFNEMKKRSEGQSI